jgi:hypothetical protein
VPFKGAGLDSTKPKSPISLAQTTPLLAPTAASRIKNNEKVSFVSLGGRDF